MEMKGKTSSGFNYQVSNERLNNYELVETLADMEANPMLLPKVVTMLLGSDQAKKLKDHLRTEDGLVPVEKIEKEVTEIFQNQAAAKNS